MSQQKKQPDEKSEKSSPKSDRRLVNGTCIQVLAWMLLTVGLCIIGLVLYLALQKQNNIHVTDTEGRARDNNSSNNYNPFEGDSNRLNFSQQIRGLSSNTLTPVGCAEVSCRIVCSDNKDVYTDIAATMQSSPCTELSSLTLSHQNRKTIQDNWIDLDYTVLTIVISNSAIKKLKSGAFNSPMFAKVLHMSWYELELKEVSSGALLGLYSLSKLEIDTVLDGLSLSFLQPVQTTLTQLRLNAEISLNSTSSLFDGIYFGKLWHLDLSYNSFRGPLGKQIFTSTPKVTHLYLKYCYISYIEDNAFEDIGSQLVELNLANNLLLTLNMRMLTLESLMLIEVEPNYWTCCVLLKSFVQFYKANSNKFASTPYCRSPIHLAGTSFMDLDVEQLPCYNITDLFIENSVIPQEVVSTGNVTTTTTPTTPAQDRTTTPKTTPRENHPIDITYVTDNLVENGITAPPILGAVVQFSCSPVMENSTLCDNKVEKKILTGVDIKTVQPDPGTFVFEPPKYDLKLEYFENQGLVASIESYNKADELNIIWFTEHFETDVHSVDSVQRDYNCMNYESPFILIEALRRNATYTFCMMPKDVEAISPLYCQPFHLPSNHPENENDVGSEKQFTIAMLCLIFSMSTLFGSVLAYLGIKAYPDLLEGSKNVLVVKESDKTCYVSTISDSENLRYRSIKKSSSRNLFRNDDAICLPERPESSGASQKEFMRMSSTKSSTGFAMESFSNPIFQDDEYETPKQFNYSVKKRCDSKYYERKPASPPPLPKRNSNFSLMTDKPTSLTEAEDPKE